MAVEDNVPDQNRSELSSQDLNNTRIIRGTKFVKMFVKILFEYAHIQQEQSGTARCVFSNLCLGKKFLFYINITKIFKNKKYTHLK